MKKTLANEFEIKDRGQLRYFLVMEIARTKKGISISQRKYTLDLVEETWMLGCKPANKPMEENWKYRDTEVKDLVDKGRYQRLVGRLIYLSHTRPDIAFVVSVASQHMHSPHEVHFEAIYRILRYLKMTPGNGFLF